MANKRSAVNVKNQRESEEQKGPKRSKQNDAFTFAECSFDVVAIYGGIDKEKKNKTRENVIKHVVALLNSGGGLIRIFDYGDNENKVTSRDKFIKGLEEELKKIIPRDKYKQCVHYSNTSESPYCLFVRKCEHVCTQISGLKMPFQRSVDYASYEDICNILKGNMDRDPSSEPSSLEMSEEEDMDVEDSGYTEDSSDKNNNHFEEFHYGKKISFDESDTVQFKYINDDGKNALKVLLKGFDNNHLKNYVSAFANCQGGKVYFGVEDNGTIKGQRIEDEDAKCKIEEAVEKIIARKNENGEMIRIWREPGFVPKYGEQWTVEFIDVVGSPENEARCIIVVEIFSFEGGMFLEHPLAWKVFETSEEIVQMDFEEWRNRHIGPDAGDEDQEMLKRFENIELNGVNRRVYQVKDMVKKFAKNVFPARKKLTVVPENFADPLKLENSCINQLVQKLKQIYSDNDGFVLVDKSWAGNVGIEPAPSEVLSDMFLMSLNGMPRMITVARNQSQAVLNYNIKLAKKLKQALVNKGGCLECFGIDAHVVLVEDINNEMKLPPPKLNYPTAYQMTEQLFKRIREALVIVLASFECSSFNPRVGLNFLYVLTPKQYNISIKEDPFIIVEAPPGTGKTVVAIERIKRLRNRDVPRKEILYICENKSLASYIRSLRIGKSTSGLCISLTRAAFMLIIEGPYGYHEFDDIRHVVVDEAQNFRNDREQDWFKSLLEILKWANDSEQNYDNTSLFICYDQLQKIRYEDCGLGLLTSNGQRQMLSSPLPIKCQLTSVIRNSKKIFQHWENIARAQPGFKRSSLEIAHDYKGRDVNVIKLPSKADESEIKIEVEKIVREILHENSYKACDIAVLCDKKEVAECLEQYLRNRLGICVTNAEAFPRTGLVVDSFRRFSGLEAPVVIAVAPKKYEKYEDVDKVKIFLYSRAMVQFYFIEKK